MNILYELNKKHNHIDVMGIGDVVANKSHNGTPMGGDAATYGIRLHAVAIKPNSSKDH